MANQWIEKLFHLPFAVDLLLRLTLLLALAWGLHFLLARANPRWRVLLWRCVAVALLAIPVAMLLLPAIEIALLPAPEASSTVTGIQSAMAFDAVPARAMRPPEQTWRILLSQNLLLLWTLLWVSIAGGLLFRAILLNVRFHHRLQDARPAPPELVEMLRQTAASLGCKRPVELRIATWSSIPFLIGIRRPRLILPERMQAEDYRRELPAVFAHELAHLRSEDIAWMGLTEFVRALLWFHPLAWKIKTVHCAACEAVCDAVAAGYVGGSQDYSRTLSRVALELTGTVSPIGGLPMARSARICQRLEQLKRGLSHLPLPRKWVTTSLLMGSLLWIGLSTLRPGYAESQKAKDRISAVSNEQIESRLDRTIPALQLRDAALSKALLLIGQVGEIPMDDPSGLTGTVTIDVQNKSVREVLDGILHPFGYRYRIQDGKLAIDQETVLVSRTYQLNPETAAEKARLITELWPLLSSSGKREGFDKVHFDADRHTLTIYGTQEDYAEAERLLSATDVRGVQDNRFPVQRPENVSFPRGMMAVPGMAPAPADATGRVPGRVLLGQQAMASTVSGSTPQVLIETLFTKYDDSISLGKDSGRWMSVSKGKDQDGRITARSLQPEEYQRMKAALQKKKLVLAAPRVTVLDNSQATIKIEGGNPQYELTVTPSIQDRNRIVLDIDLDLTEDMSPEGTPSEEKAVRSRTLTSRVMIGSGEAIEEFLEQEGSRDYAIIIQAEIVE